MKIVSKPEPTPRRGVNGELRVLKDDTYYWINSGGEWFIAHYHDDRFLLSGSTEPQWLSRVIVGDEVSEPRDIKPSNRAASLDKLRRKLGQQGKDEILVWLSDQHAPLHDPVAHTAIMRLLYDLRPHEIICGGDLVDMQAISPHLVKKNNLRQIAASRLKTEIEAGARLLDDYQKHCKKLTYLEGNHEFWVERWINANPQLEGLLEVENQLQLKKRGIQWIPSWRDKQLVYRKGKAGFLHGIYTGKYHTKRMSEEVDCNIFYGHTHDTNSFARSFLGQKDARIAQALGCLCLPQPYMQGNPDNWQQALAIFHFRKDGFFNYDLLRIFDGGFYWGKTFYSGKS